MFWIGEFLVLRLGSIVPKELEGGAVCFIGTSASAELV